MCCCLLNVANQQRDKKKKQGDQHHEERLSEVDQGMNYQPLMQYSDDQSRRWKEREMSAMVSALKHVVAGDIDVVASQPQQIQQHDNMNAITNVTSTAANSDSSSSYGITSGQKRAREMEGGGVRGKLLCIELYLTLSELFSFLLLHPAESLHIISIDILLILQQFDNILLVVHLY